MKAVILAGGLGTRISEESQVRPKPMVEIGGMPILWHIMKLYSVFNVTDFIICCGYKSEVILDYFIQRCTSIINTKSQTSTTKLEFRDSGDNNWTVTLVDTGLYTNTAGRIVRLSDLLRKEERFFLTYGDGIGDIDLEKLVSLHLRSKSLVTLTATQPPSRYGVIEFGAKGKVISFSEKPKGNKSWINGGFFVVESIVLDQIKNDNDSWEMDILPRIANHGLLYAYRHDGFWHPMDTVREKDLLNQLWNRNKAPWKLWNET